MAWSFYFQGVREDAEAALNSVTTDTGPGSQDQLDRAKALILQELQAMQPGTVVAECYGKFYGTPPLYRSSMHISVQNRTVINNAIESPPNKGTVG